MTSRNIIGNKSSLQDKKNTLIFHVIKDGRIYPAMIVQIGQNILAYLNVCPHAGLPLNGFGTDVFCRQGKKLMCHAHGALFDPDNGLCIDGPGKGMSLIPLTIEVNNGGDITLTDRDYTFHIK